MGKIILNNMEFFAYHGCFKEEQIIGGRFLVDLEFETDTSKAETSDQLIDTINYQSVYQIVAHHMSSKSHLLEHIGRRISDAIMDTFPGIGRLNIRISKMNPPLGGKIGSVCIELTTSR